VPALTKKPKPIVNNLVNTTLPYGSITNGYFCVNKMLMETRGTILIADDEVDILEILSYNLSKEGYKVVEAKDGNQALDLAKQHQPNLIILDIMMPYKTGIEVCNMLRSQPAYNDTLIIMLTALSDESNHIKGLDSGADDYISKPISPKILVSRVNALFRRVQKESAQQVLHIGNMTIDPVRFMVTYDGHEVILAKKEFELLYLLASRPGRVFLRNEILSNVWGTDVIVGDRTIDVHIRKIRQKLNEDCITTVKGVGYKFQ
jgi:two-component system, OmpR family, alkaline phosphatase synthesis response regulator PhoP